MKSHSSFLTTLAAVALGAVVLTGCYKFSGGGQLIIDSGGVFDSAGAQLADFTGDVCTVAFNGQPTDPSDASLVPARGQLQLIDHTAGITFHGVINETGNSAYRWVSDHSAAFWGAEGKIKIGNGRFVPIDSFQLNVSAPEGGPTTAFLGVTIGDRSLTWSGTLEAGNFTLHKD